jgi:hypothetical protein
VKVPLKNAFSGDYCNVFVAALELKVSQRLAYLPLQSIPFDSIAQGLSRADSYSCALRVSRDAVDYKASAFGHFSPGKNPFKIALALQPAPQAPQADSLLRPFDLLRFRIVWPSWVLILFIKPCSFFRILLFGWYVLFIYVYYPFSG